MAAPADDAESACGRKALSDERVGKVEPGTLQAVARALVAWFDFFYRRPGGGEAEVGICPRSDFAIVMADRCLI